MAVLLGYALLHRIHLEEPHLEFLAGRCELCGEDSSVLFLDSERAFEWATEHMFDH